MRVVALAIAVALSSSCGGRRPVLLPAPGAPLQAAGRDVVRLERDGVALLLEGVGRDWAPELPRGVSAVRVQVLNGSEAPLALEPAQFTLAGGDGFQFSALPPALVARVEWEEQLPRFYSDELSLYSWYGVGRSWRAGGVGTQAAGAPLLPFAGRPRKRIVLDAVPEGVLAPGGRAHGLLYFRTQEMEGEPLTFRARWQSAEDGRTLALMEVPLMLCRDGGT